MSDIKTRILRTIDFYFRGQEHIDDFKIEDLVHEELLLRNYDKLIIEYKGESKQLK